MKEISEGGGTFRIKTGTVQPGQLASGVRPDAAITGCFPKGGTQLDPKEGHRRSEAVFPHGVPILRDLLFRQLRGIEPMGTRVAVSRLCAAFSFPIFPCHGD